jgi:SAM-dependent methyltransferase
MEEHNFFAAAENVERSGFGRPGFAEQYHAVREYPPAVVVDLLTQYARCVRPRLVVDLGCGTGLSTQLWVDRAEAVIGIEPLGAMLAVARVSVRAVNVGWRQAFAHETGLADGSVDIAVCVQSCHWMEPQPTLREVARILRPGGVFAAVNLGMPLYDWEVLTAATQFRNNAHRRRDELGLRVGVQQARHWPMDRHLQEMRDSGCFEQVREMAVHKVATISAEGMVANFINHCVDFYPELKAAGVSDAELGLDEFRRVADLRMGSAGTWFTWYWVRLGIRNER